MEKDLLSGKVWKTLLFFALPILGANLLQAMYGTIDLFIVGQFATKSDVSAVSTGSMTLQTIAGIIIGLTMGSTIHIGHKIGMKEYEKASKTVGASLVLFLCIGIVLTVLVSLLAKPLAIVMNAPEDALEQTINYIFICGLGIISIVFFNAISGIFRGIGDSKSPLILMVVASIVNVIGDLILVAIFHLGSEGAAIATVVAQFFSVLFAYIIFKKKGLGFEFKKEHIRPYKEETIAILKYGTPIAIQEFLTGISFMVILAILNGFGLVASAGVGIAEKICALIFIVPIAMMDAVSAFAAQNIGAKNISRAKEGMLVGMGAAVFVGLIMFFISFFYGEWLAYLFTPEWDVCLASANYLKSYSIDCILVGVNFAIIGYLNGKGKTTFVALQGIVSTFLVRIPFSLFMSKVENVTLFQVGFATPLATAFAIILNVTYLLIVERRSKKDILIAN